MRYEELQSKLANCTDGQTFLNYIFNECGTIPGFNFTLKTGVYYILQTCQDELICFLLDKGNGEVEELADEDSFSGENPFYFTARSHRISPVFCLWQIMHFYKTHFNKKNVYGVLLSDNIFVNKDDLSETWSGLGIIVVSGLKDIPESIPYSYQNELDIELNIKELANPIEYTKEIEEVLFRNSIEEQTIGNTIASEPKPDKCAKETESEISWEDLLEDDNDPDFFETIVNKKIPKPLPAIKILPPLLNPTDKLNSLTALENVKKRIGQISALAEYNKRLLNLGIKTVPMNFHSVFVGAPGTGKTTVAQIMGSLFHQYGLLSKGHTIVSNRSSFVGKLWGSEEENVRKILKLAQGGVLLIDEAYLLFNENEPRDPANHILPLMMDLLGNEKNRDIIIILCGYRKNIDRLLDSNPGLRSRFRNTVIFDDFSFSELSEILYNRAKENGYKFTSTAWLNVLNVINRHIKKSSGESYANARSIINIWEQILENHACRCVVENINDLESIMLITNEDISNL